MKSFGVAILLLLLSVSARSESLDDTFQEGVLGVPWGMTLDQLVGLYPGGDHVFATTPGCRAYWIKDGQTFLSVPRPANGALFSIDKDNKVVGAVVAFDFERQLELRSVLTQMFGMPGNESAGKTIHQYGWRARSGLQVAVTELGEGYQKIIWLSIYTPDYRRGASECGS